MKVRKAAALVASVALSITALGACSSGGEKAESAGELTDEGSADAGLKIGFVLASTPVSRWAFDVEGFKDKAAELGAEAIVVDSASTTQQQRAAIENMITRQVDAIVITPADVDTANTVFQLAADEGIPTIDYNFMVEGYAPDYTIARDAREFGQITAEEALEAHPTGKYVILSGDPANTVAQDTTAGYMDVLQPEIDAGNIEVVSQKFNAQWSPQSAQTQVEQALVQTGNVIDVVLSNNDGMAIGAMEALKNAGLEGQAFVAGVDADEPNLARIAAGDQTMTIWTDFYAMGAAAAEVAVAAAKGEVPSLDLTEVDLGAGSVPTIMMDAVVINHENLASWLKESGWADCDAVFSEVADSPC